jgi:type IV secretory pathway VirB3-like protein
MKTSSTDRTERMDREDTIHVGATRPASLFGLPYPLAMALLFVAYMIQTNLGGWYGLSWAVAAVGPCWVLGYLIVRHDTYGANVVVGWTRTGAFLLDKRIWGGSSCSPLPARKRKIRTQS